jgi:cytoskeleton protein RodZ
MTDPRADASAGDSAGALLRAARERQGMHIAALAATIKITVHKLEALEHDRYDELPDATFTRALALTVCRALKIDPSTVLARLPQGGATGLSQAKGGLNMPFRERPGHADPADRLVGMRPLVWAALLILLAAVLVYVLPADWWRSLWPQTSVLAELPAPVPLAVEPAGPTAGTSTVVVAPAEAASASDLAASAAGEAVVEVMHSMPSASASADGPGGVAVLRVADATWVEVVDAGGQLLVSRTLQPGESIGLDGALPFKVKIGNAQGAELSFRSQPVNLVPFTRDNVVRLELK